MIEPKCLCMIHGFGCGMDGTFVTTVENVGQPQAKSGFVSERGGFRIVGVMFLTDGFWKIDREVSYDGFMLDLIHEKYLRRMDDGSLLESEEDVRELEYG